MTWGLWGYDATSSRTAGSYPSDDQVDAAEVMNGIRTLADFSHRTHPGAAAFLDMPPDEQFDHFNTHLAPLYERHGLPIPGSGGWLDFTDAVKEHWRGPRTAARTAMPTYYHHTDNPDFRPDPDHVPTWMRNLGHPGGPGLFVTHEDRPDMWSRGADSYRAEFHSPEDITKMPGVFSENYGLEGAPLEIFVPGEQMDNLEFRGLHPYRRTAMPAPMPQGITFHYHPTNDTIPTHEVPSYGPRWAPDTLVEDTMFDAPAVEARHNGKHVGYLEWSTEDRPGHVVNFPGEIANVHVEKPYRRHGIADAMLDFARQHEPRVNHSDRLTDLGSMWRDHNQKNKKANFMTAAVTVYTKPNCPQCTMTKKQLDRLGIEHTTVDVTVDPDARAYVTGLGYQTAPVVVVNGGERHWAGFRPDHLKELISE